MSRRVPVPVVPFLLLSGILLACSDDKVNGPDNTPPTDAGVDEYVAGLGTWSAYAPPLIPGDVPVGAAETTDELVNNVTYQCSETPYSITETPREIVMYEPNASIMWVGNLLQGKSYRNGTGSFQELSIRQRAPLKISIDLLTGDNFAIVENPTLTSVQAAIGGLIQRATDAGHVSGSSVDFTSFRMNTALEAALRMGMSATFIGQGVPVELDVESQIGFNASTNAVMAHFVQKMFTISIELPQNASDFFSDGFTQAVLNQQVAAGNIGPDNLPVYIASITYGRTLDYSMLGGHAEVVQHAAVEASLMGVKGAPSGYLESDLKAALTASSIKVTAIGGDGASIINLIRTERLADYFTGNAPLTSARPISYQLNYLGDNTVAKVSETQQYTQRTCNQKPATPGRFQFNALQSEAAGIPAPYTVHSGDVNGDGRSDLILNHLNSGSNRTRVAFGAADGTFAFQPPFTHAATPAEGWADGYRMYVGDFNGDGADDLVWNRRKAPAPNTIYVAVNSGTGTFDLRPRHDFTGPWANEWKTFTGDVTGDGRDDLVFNYLTNTGNFTHIAVASGDTFALGKRMDHSIGSGWGHYTAYLADIDGGGKDLIWSSLPGAENRVHTARWSPLGTLSSESRDYLSGWQGYSTHIGDFDGDGRADMIWTKAGTDSAGAMHIHRARGGIDTRFTLVAGVQSVTRPSEFSGDSVGTVIGDFNGDGLADIVFNQLNAANRVAVGLGSATGTFSFSSLPQTHPVFGEDWSQFRANRLVMDVNGDGMYDIVWIDPTATMRTYVALGKTPGP